MSVLTSYLIAICLLFPAAASDSFCSETVLSQNEEWLVMDTLDLPLSGPCYEVAFFREDIMFLKHGEEIIYCSGSDNFDAANGRLLFTNKQFSTSPSSFSFRGDYRKGYYSRSLKKEENKSVEKIFEINIENREVSDLKQLSFTADQHRYLHPAISSDDSLMVFSSDRLPTSGGLDLFITRNTIEGWSSPQNLGEEINSGGHERFPFLDGQNNLWFSSSGNSGYGAYDIFVCRFNGKDWDSPQNLGRNVNGPDNELGLSIHPEKQVALFTRTLASGTGGMAIRITLNENAIASYVMEDVPAGDISAILLGLADPAEKQAVQAQAEPIKEVPEQEVKIDYPEPAILTDPDRIIFRVQVKSSESANSTPMVNIAGESYNTYEYFYKGAYRITVGKFETLEEANAFRLQCKKARFDQAFVAAFRGNKRETNPSVFKK